MSFRFLIHFALTGLASAAPSSVSHLSAPTGFGGGTQSANNIEVQNTTGNTIEGGTATSSDGRIIHRGGYTGQLVDFVDLRIDSSQISIPESGQAELSAKARLDDGTMNNLNANEITWQIITGPISSISNLGLVTTAAVFLDQDAIVEGRFRNIVNRLPLMVRNTDPDNFGSYAGDGLDDDWQVQFFGLNNPNAQPKKDPDGDGQNNQFEFLALVDPTDARSNFRFFVGLNPEDLTQVQITFEPIATGRVYTIEASPDLSPDSYRALSNPIISTTGNRRKVIDPAPSAINFFYRVGISKP